MRLGERFAGSGFMGRYFISIVLVFGRCIRILVQNGRLVEIISVMDKSVDTLLLYCRPIGLGSGMALV